MNDSNSSLITNRYKAILVVVLLFAAGLWMNAGMSAKSKSLYGAFEGKDSIHVFVSDITESKGPSHADLKNLKKKIKKAFSAHEALNFRLVSQPAKAHILIQCDVVDYYAAEQGPQDDPKGVAGVAFDAMIQRDYSRLQAVFAVEDAETKKVLWRKKLKAILTEVEEGIEDQKRLVNTKITQLFINESFGTTARR